MVLLPVLYIATVISVGTISNYEPEQAEPISTIQDTFLLGDTSAYTALIWNIGYAGLGAEMDFFYDGGEKVRDSRENVQNNLGNIAAWLERNDSIDFILLQEVDEKSKRSYKSNQVNVLNKVLSSHYSFFCLNYHVRYVPMPFLRPMGKVKSGLLSYSRHIPLKSIRYSFPGNYGWPKGIFMLDRCFMEQRFPLNNGKELVVINTHNSAYDDGSLRKEQLNYLRSFLLEEETNGNYVLIGGDWNQCPPGFIGNFSGEVFDTVNLQHIQEGYPREGWSFVYDGQYPTNRRVKTVYKKGKTPVTLIDYFLVSPNIEVLKVQGVDMGFRYSDHNPLIIHFKLNS